MYGSVDSMDSYEDEQVRVPEDHITKPAWQRKLSHHDAPAPTPITPEEPPWAYRRFSHQVVHPGTRSQSITDSKDTKTKPPTGDSVDNETEFPRDVKKFFARRHSEMPDIYRKYNRSWQVRRGSCSKQESQSYEGSVEDDTPGQVRQEEPYGQWDEDEHLSQHSLGSGSGALDDEDPDLTRPQSSDSYHADGESEGFVEIQEKTSPAQMSPPSGPSTNDDYRFRLPLQMVDAELWAREQEAFVEKEHATYVSSQLLLLEPSHTPSSPDCYTCKLTVISGAPINGAHLYTPDVTPHDSSLHNGIHHVEDDENMRGVYDDRCLMNDTTYDTEQREAAASYVDSILNSSLVIASESNHAGPGLGAGGLPPPRSASREQYHRENSGGSAYNSPQPYVPPPYSSSATFQNKQPSYSDL